MATCWTASGLISWQSAPTADQVANAIDPLGGCALTEAVGGQAWQLTTLGNAGTAIQDGQRQFPTSSRLFVGDTPWAVVAQGDRALPVVRVASDPRNGLALLEVIGPADSILHEPAPTFASETGEREASLVHTVNYAAGRADRFAMSAALLRRVSERLFDLAGGWSPFRYSAPVVDICTREILGIMTTQVGALRADSLVDALAQLRANRMPTPPLASAPRLTGSSALLPALVYVGTTQPEFRGWICNVRPSAQYHVHYAVYLHGEPSLSGACDGGRQRAMPREHVRVE